MDLEITVFGDYKVEDILSYAHINDAGIDVYFQRDIYIKPGSNRIPLGFNIKLPKGLMGLVFPRSSIMGMGIQFNCAPIDADYTGEYNLICYNATNETIKFEKGSKIVQLVITNCIHVDGIKCPSMSYREDNGIGSTGK